MSGSFLFKFLCLLGLSISSMFSFAPAQSRYIVLKNATVIDCLSDKPFQETSVVIKDSLIYDIGKFGELHFPVNATIIDASGKYILPGLIDSHAHVTILGMENGKRFFDRGASEKVLRLLLEHGITTVRNPAAPASEGIQLRNDVRQEKVVGPDIYTSGEAIQYCNGRAPDLWETCVSNEAEAAAEVNRQIDKGVDFIKVYSSVPENIVRVITKTAHDRQVPVCGHLGVTSWANATRFGIDAFEHVTDWNPAMLPSDKREAYQKLVASAGGMKARITWLEWLNLEGNEVAGLIESVRKDSIIVDATLIAYATKFMGNDSVYIANPEMNKVPELVSNWKRGTFVDDWTKQDFEQGREQWKKVLKLVKKYYEGGVILVMGSDLPNPWVIPGVSLCQEMQLFSQAGIPNYEILKMCTVNPAKALKIYDKIGTIEKGKIANLIILNENPLINISNINSVDRVFKRGKNFLQ